MFESELGVCAGPEARPVYEEESRDLRDWRAMGLVGQGTGVGFPGGGDQPPPLWSHIGTGYFDGHCYLYKTYVPPPFGVHR